MNFFLKGDFKIQESWQQKPPSRASNSRDKSREKDKNNSLVNAGKNILAQPSTDLLDDQISKKILRDFAAEIPSVKTEKKSQKKEDSLAKLPPKQKGPPMPQSDNDLLTSMAARLQVVEKTCKNQRQEIRQKSQELQKLKNENTFLKGFREDANKQYEKMKTLEAQNGELKKKVEEMQTYLKKYGLKWVGNKIEGKMEHEQMKKDIKKGNYNYRLPSEIDINTIIRRVQELNSRLHSEGMGTEVFQENGVHKFRKADPLPIGFFANGIAIKGFKFLTYKSKQSLQILGDFIDGYFPYILKEKYPNGVFLRVVDKVAEKYNNESSSQAISTFESNESKDFKPPSKEQFLNKLPKQVIKNGKVINIRGEIEKRLNGQTEKQIKQQVQEQDSQVFEKMQGLKVFKTETNENFKQNSTNELQFCTIKIRNEQGEVFILRLEKESKVRQIYSWMNKVTRAPYKLMSNFPRRTYELDETATLDELGFCPNAMLHIQNSPK